MKVWTPTNKLKAWLARYTNAVLAIWENPCDVPWIVMVELAREPAGKAILELVEPSLLDVIRGYMRPKGLRGGGHMRRKTPKNKRPPKGQGIPDTSELIAKHLPGYAAVSKRQVSDGVRFLWAIDNVIQRGFWYWLVADVLGGFLINWHSAIMRSEYCSMLGPYAGAMECEPFPVWTSFPVSVGNAIPLYERGGVFYIGFSTFSTPDGSISVRQRLVGGPEGTIHWLYFQFSKRPDGLILVNLAVGPITPPDSIAEVWVEFNGNTLWSTGEYKSNPARPDDGKVMPPMLIGPGTD